MASVCEGLCARAVALLPLSELEKPLCELSPDVVSVLLFRVIAAERCSGR